MSVRYGLLIEIELVWQSLGAEQRYAVQHLARSWRGSEGRGVGRPLAQIAGTRASARCRSSRRWCGARQIGDGWMRMPLDVCVAADLPSAAADTIKLLAERTARTCEALRRRALGVTELDGEKPAGTPVRTLRNMPIRGRAHLSFRRADRTAPRDRADAAFPAGVARAVPAAEHRHARGGAPLWARDPSQLLDRRLGADVDLVLADPVPAARQRVYAHIAAHLPYYSATIIAAGDRRNGSLRSPSCAIARSPLDRCDREHRGRPRGQLRRLSAPVRRRHDARMAQRAHRSPSQPPRGVAGVHLTCRSPVVAASDCCRPSRDRE